MAHTLTDEVRARRALPAPSMARAIRVSAGVTQERLAREVGVTRATVARWEASTRRPKGAHLERYAAVLAALQEALAA